MIQAPKGCTIQKQVLGSMERCYCASHLTVDGRLYAILASEAIGGPCYAYTGPDFTEKEVIWENAGGTMSLVQIPGTNGEFLAVQNFFPGFQSEKAKIVWGKRDAQKGWLVQDLIDLPYVHRFDVFPVGDEVWFLGATLCGSKKDREDWSDPGKVYVGKLPAAPGEPMPLTPVLENLTKNHGYCRGEYEGRQAGFVTSEEGIFAVLPPTAPGGQWQTVHMVSRPVGDVAFADLDGDGVKEMATIEPFHGDKFLVSKAEGTGWRQVYAYPGEIQFAHAVVGCTLGGAPAVVGGIRRMEAELFCIQYQNGAYTTTVLERGIGPSNADVVNLPDGRDVIISANHTRNEAALYWLEKA